MGFKAATGVFQLTLQLRRAVQQAVSNAVHRVGKAAMGCHRMGLQPVADPVQMHLNF